MEKDRQKMGDFSPFEEGQGRSFTPEAFQSPLVASMTYQNDRQEKSRRLVHFPTTQSTIGTQKIAKIMKLIRSDTTLMTEK